MQHNETGADVGAGPGEISDAELTALAVAANPDVEIPDDAPCLWDLTGEHGNDLLPAWYMPAVAGGGRVGTLWRRWAAGVVIAAFLSITAAGLCDTYGQLFH